MWAIVKNNAVVGTVHYFSNVQGLELLHTDVRLVERAVLLADGVYDFIEAPEIDQRTTVETGSTFMIDDVAGTVTRQRITVAKAQAEIDAWDANDADNKARQTLSATDLKLPRAIEDLIGILKTKGLITDADLPQAVKDLIAARKTARTKLKPKV